MYDQSRAFLLAGHRVYGWGGGPLASTELRVHCERNQTKLYHGQLWRRWGETVESKYDPAPPYDSDKKVALRKQFAKIKRDRSGEVGAMVMSEASSKDGILVACGVDMQDKPYHDFVRLLLVVESSVNKLKAQVSRPELLPVLMDLLKHKGLGEISAQSPNGMFTDKKRKVGT
jgi:hypothetical protein